MRTRRPQASSPNRTDASFRHLPFRALADIGLRGRAGTAPHLPARSITVEPAVNEVSEESLFRREMADVRPLSARPGRIAQPSPARPRREIVDADAEALAELSDLVTGIGPFDITNTEEYLEGTVIGLDPRLVGRLRAGEFAYQSHLDLHGMNAEEARLAVDRFLTLAYRRGHRCVLIIHGRGLNSEGHTPVLKKRLASWLVRGAHARLVLAFTSARPCDGGAGALYVLLRRQRRAKQRMRVTEGSGS
jgi:DNA-nicking Smr family endonuclease